MIKRDLPRLLLKWYNIPIQRGPLPTACSKIGGAVTWNSNSESNGGDAMKNQVMNPYLPLWEYIPDGEPRIFGDRLYVYGSHDFAGVSMATAPATT